jgi:hypothetical protein
VPFRHSLRAACARRYNERPCPSRATTTAYTTTNIATS